MSCLYGMNQMLSISIKNQLNKSGKKINKKGNCNSKDISCHLIRKFFFKIYLFVAKYILLSLAFQKGIFLIIKSCAIGVISIVYSCYMTSINSSHV